MSDTVIKVENLAKRYRLGVSKKKGKTFSEEIFNILRAPIDNFKKVTRLSSFKDDDESVFWALKDVNFEVKRGEVIGIIGHNGAGKSTLLKILSRITDPTYGEVAINGRISSLLEVGTGFHQELTGRENIYMNGTILGMRKREIDQKIDRIIDFSGIEKHIDTPVKFYSSGMKVRLGFSVAAHLEPEILIIDEVLAVGDMDFQKKCLGKMDEVAHKDGRTILFVSHNMAAIRSLCTSGILMNHGGIELIGSTEEVASRYLKGSNELDGEFDFAAAGNEIAAIRKVILTNQDRKVSSDFQIGDDLTVELHYYAATRIDKPYFLIGIRSKFGSICGANMLMDGQQPVFIEGNGVLKCTFKSIPFLPQQYTLTAGIRAQGGKAVLSPTREVGYFNILTKISDIGFNGYLADSLASESAPVLLPYSWTFDDNTTIDVNFLKYAKR